MYLFCGSQQSHKLRMYINFRIATCACAYHQMYTSVCICVWQTDGQPHMYSYLIKLLHTYRSQHFKAMLAHGKWKESNQRYNYLHIHKYILYVSSCACAVKQKLMSSHTSLTKHICSIYTLIEQTCLLRKLWVSVLYNLKQLSKLYQIY